MKRFRFKPSINVTYDRQGAIYFTVRRYHGMPEQKKKRVNELMRAAAGENWEALRDYLTGDEKVKDVLKRYYIASFTTINGAVKKFMEAFPDDLL